MEVPAHPIVPRIVAPLVPEEASTLARSHAPGSASSSDPFPPSPTIKAAITLARGMERLGIADPAPPAPSARSLTQVLNYLSFEPPLVSRKGIAHPVRPGFGTLGRRVAIRANHFLVEVGNNDICHYYVSISPEPKARRTNRVQLSELVRVHGATSLAHKMPAYDGSRSLYTAGELPFKSMDFVVKLGRQEIEYKVAIRYAARANLYHLQQFLNGLQRDSPYDTIQALDVVMRESPSLNYVSISRSFFSKRFGSEDIGDGMECWRDICSTSFYKSIPVIQFVVEFLRVTNPLQPFSDRDRLKIKKALHGVRVETTHRQGKRSIYKITGITSVPLAQLSFSWNNGPQLTVVQYFVQQYKYRLQYTAWPCLQSGNNSKPIYLPMEVCQIIEGQKYTRKLSDIQVASILKATCKRPQERENSIILVWLAAAADRLAQVFGITVANQMANVQARVLPPPMLKYHESGREKIVAPSDGQWNMINKKMLNGGTVHSWTCLNFSRMPPHVVDRICDDLARMCNSIGMVFNPRPVTEVQSASPNHIEAALRNVHMRAPNLQLLIMILPDVSGHYAKIKRLCETDLGIISQCINPKPNKNKQYFESVALKINVKVGGRNTVLERASMTNGRPFVSDVPTIIFGADVSHPPAGEDSSASIAAAHRQEIIQNLFWTGTDPETGTVVDTSICHPSEFDFYLCSHAGIKGTSRPTHYHVLYDKNRFSADALQMLTNSLCYTSTSVLTFAAIGTQADICFANADMHASRVLSQLKFYSKSLLRAVPPAYYAHLAAFRARYYDEQADGGASAVSGAAAFAGGGPAAFRRLPEVKDNVKEVMFFC
ncbi:hypothetical protein C2845_PM04G05340 [Panicum miliaceum]|uniref:Uncharacterized protein n=1 Tax=Panicum miliaceum TaxID=4540 RepID=A0A3L6QQ31_PANMI|nr:hypothetical protein C2845_PM04G05340 [Panicum miliaceum]